MNPQFYHQELKNQIATTLGDNPELSEAIKDLLSKVSSSYTQYDQLKKQLEEKVKLRTDQLMSSTSRAYSFLDSINMGFIMCDVSGEVVLTNQSVKKILTPENENPNETYIKDWNIENISNALEPQIHLKDAVKQSLNQGQVIEVKEINYKTKVFHIYIAPMINTITGGEQQKLGSVILIDDITEQKVLERSKDEFLSIASHELRTPLTAIRGNASLLKKYYGDQMPNSDTVEMIDDIHESSIRLIDIVNDFLDASSLEQGKMQLSPEPFNIQDIIGETVRELHAWADSKQVTLNIDQSVQTTPSVSADKHRIKQVLYNLIGNAIKFTDSGSVSIRTNSNDNLIYVYISDSGKGMEPKYQQLLFRKFQQAGNNFLSRDNTKGTGMGLYISKLIVEQSGGSIKLESSELNKGSTFVFTVPKTPNI